ncbi:nuclear transport factor 2 family protein [Streptomyces sp. L7]
MSSTPSAADLLRRTFDTFLAKDMKAWTDLCADDVVAEFPFAPQGSPARIEGREALYDYLRGYPDLIDIREIPSVRVYPTVDENVAVAGVERDRQRGVQRQSLQHELRDLRDLPRRTRRQLPGVLEPEGLPGGARRRQLLIARPLCRTTCLSN